jgi:PAS domain S-box-containing protein
MTTNTRAAIFAVSKSMAQAFLLVLVMAVPIVAAAAVQVEKHKSVLILLSEDSNLPAQGIIEQSLLSTLKNGSPVPLEVYSEYLDYMRTPVDSYEQELMALLRRKYEGRKFDLIIAVLPTALGVLLKNQSEIFPDTPLVFLVLDQRNVAGLRLGPNVTGVWGTTDFKPNLDLALALQPKTRKVVVLAGVSEFDKYWTAEVREDFLPYEGKLEITYLIGLTIAEQQQALASLPQNTIVFLVATSQDNAGNNYSTLDALRQISPASSAPIYGFTDAQIGVGTVGGSIISFEALGAQAAGLGLRVLSGEKPQAITPYRVPNLVMFDWRELRRWGISEQNLPAGSIVRFKQPTLWEQYKWHIGGAVSLIILQALLIIGLLLNRAKRRKAEEASKLSETRYRNVVETQTELICRYQPDTTLTFVNDAYCRYFGKSSEQLIGTKFSELLPEHARDAALAHIASLIENPRSENYEHEVVLPNGETGWQEWVNHVAKSTIGGGIELQGIGRDITEKRQAEEELRQSETRFRHMADTSEIFIWIADANMLCTYFNRRVLDFTGRTMDQLLGEGWLEIIHQDDVQRCVDTYTAGYQKREPFVLEFRIRRADGEFRWIYDTGSPRLAADGELIGYIGSAVDITDRRAAEEALQIAHEEVSKLKNQLEEENIYLREEIKLAHNFDQIVGRSDATKYVLFKIEQVAPTDTTVLITGETGTGKELVAHAIHGSSSRRDRPLVKLNCAALSPTLIESELFGHEKGAFTGATARRIGRFELANGATIFLDEIGELPLELQAKLLRLIQENEFERLGSSKTIKVDARIIAATNRNLKIAVEQGTFREDLWYRLNVFPITVPPLRDRKEDIPVLVEHFVKRFSQKVGRRISSIPPASMRILQEYAWPGNVRELANVLERAVINTNGTVLRVVDHFEKSQVTELSRTDKTLEEIEKEYIVRILDSTSWRIEGHKGAARILGLNPSTLRTRISKLGIQKLESKTQSSGAS